MSAALYRLFHPTHTKPIPEGAQIFTRKGARFARFKRGKATIEAPLVETKTGLKCQFESKTWHICYTDAAGDRQREMGFTDREATEELARKIVTGIRAELRGESSPMQRQRERPLSEHVNEFAAHLKRKELTPEHVHKTVQSVRAIVEGADFQTIADMRLEAVEQWLDDAREGLHDEAAEPMHGTAKTYQEIAQAFGVSVDAVNKWKQAGAPIVCRKRNSLEAIQKWRASRRTDRGGIAIQTRNHYAKAIKEFSRWLSRTNKTGQDPLAYLSFMNPSTDRRHDRRAISDNDFLQLVQAAMTGPTVETLPGEDRAMLYILAAWTGYRRKELASLTRRSFDLDGPEPFVTILACYSKNKRTDTTPLHPIVVERLREWLASKPELKPTDPIFPLRTPGGHWRKTALMMREDLKRAGIPYQDEDGLFADFHANRHTFISNLGRAGVPLATAQKLARHSDPKLTANVYTHLGLTDKAKAIESLPAPPMTPPAGSEQQALRATGTDDDSPADPTDGKRLRASCATACPEGARTGTAGQSKKQQDPPERPTQVLTDSRLVAGCRGGSQVHPTGLEPVTFGSVDRCSIQLS